MRKRFDGLRVRRALRGLAVIACLCLRPAGAIAQPLDTTLENFFLKGTQPNSVSGMMNNCFQCHLEQNSDATPLKIYPRWQSSMKANAVRDPVFQAALTIANQDAEFGGDMCIRCHSPGGWLAGRSVPTDGSALIGTDLEGVNCLFCHRAVDPLPRMENPVQDDPIRAALDANGLLPAQFGNGSYVIDPNNVRRGPFDDVPQNYHVGATIIYSPFHQKADLCGTCHDVSNPAFTRQPDGSYELNDRDTAHTSQNKFDMFPLERTYSEWSNSMYASTGVHANGVFGGNHPTGVMNSCQDCHMPDANAYGCGFDDPEEPFFARPDIPSHDFNGGNAWVQDMLLNLFSFSGDVPLYFEESKARAIYMLQNAATMEVTNEDCALKVRVVNETAHKLPTGYPEGRRMWITVEFRDASLEPVVERGAYDELTAELTPSDTKIYEAKQGVDENMALVAGVPEGPTFHFVLNNKIYKDNRIPPRGFSNAAFEAVQAAPVGAVYVDGQYWDDTRFHIPEGASSAVVSLYYQTASKEYIEFLRDENTTNDKGDVLYDQWQLTGMSPPVLMRQRIVFDLTPGLFGDADCSGTVDLDDYGQYAECVTGPNVHLKLGCEPLDANLDSDIDLMDLAEFQNAFGAP